MNYLLWILYIGLLISSFLHVISKEYDLACLELLLAYGTRWKIRDVFGE